MRKKNARTSLSKRGGLPHVATKWLEKAVLFLRALFGRVRDLARTIGRGPMPKFDTEDVPARGPEPGSDRGRPVHAAEQQLATEAEGADGHVAATTIVPSTRWDALDLALGTGKERWRNLATAGVAVVALIVAVSVLWTSGEDDPVEGDWAASSFDAPEPADLVPSLVFDEPLEPDLATEARPTEDIALDDADADEPLPVGVPANIAYGEPAAAPPADAPAERPVVAGASAPARVVEPEPEPDTAEVDADEAKEMAAKAGCPTGTLPTEVLPGDTVQTIAWRHAGDEGRNLIPRILDANRRLKPSAMQPGDLVCVPDVERVIVGYKNETYKIRRGDTITGLAERFPFLSRANVRALTTRARKKDMLFAGREVSLPVPQYATRL